MCNANIVVVDRLLPCPSTKSVGDAYVAVVSGMPAAVSAVLSPHTRNERRSTYYYYYHPHSIPSMHAYNNMRPRMRRTHIFFCLTTVFCI